MMKVFLLRKYIIKSCWILVIALSSFFTQAQVTVMPDCSGNPPAGNTCATATPICDLNGYCGTTSLGVYTSNSWGDPLSCFFLGDCGLSDEFCGSIENNSFLTIVADATTISFNVWVFNSSTGQGIQIAVFDTPSCGGNVNMLYCNGQMLPTGTSNYHNVVVNGLTPGNTYYIMIDGYAGDECDYVIGAEDGISVPVSIDPSEITICEGENVTLTAQGGDGTYNWDVSPDLNTTTGDVVVASPPGVGTYTYTVNSNSGNPSCPASVTAEAIVTVESCICSIDAQNTGPVCEGVNIDLTANAVTDATYEWSGPGGFTSTDLNVSGVTPPPAPGNYTYTIVATTPSGTCQSETTVTVLEIPTVNAGVDQTICEGDEVTLTADNPDGAAITWSDNVDNGDPFTPVATQTYTVTATLNGCSSTDEVEVIVEVCSCTVTAQNTGPVCEGEDIDLTATDVTDATYEWSGPGGFSASVQNGIGVTPPTTPGNYTYTVVATLPGGATCQSETTVTVGEIPTVNAGVDQTICEGEDVTLTADNPDGATITWSNSVDDGVSFSPLTTQTYTVTATIDGCSSTDEVEVVVIPTPQVDAGTYGPFCDVDPVQTLVGSPSGGVFTINGNPVTTFDPSNGSQEVIYTYSDANGCGSADTIFIVVEETPTAGFTATPLVGNPPLDVTVTNQTSGQTTGYSWIFGNGDSSSDDFQDYTTTYGESGTYEIILTVTNNGCSSSASATVIVAYPEMTYNIPNVFSPNNDNSNDYFHFSLVNADKFELTILNRWGNVMFETDDVNTKGWDGNTSAGAPAVEGTYFHKYIITDLEGNEFAGHGFLHLVRD